MTPKALLIVISIVAVGAIGTGIILSNQPDNQPQISKEIHVSAVKGSSDGYRVKDGFQPKEITVMTGVNTTVTWTNDDPGVVHTVHSDLPEFDSSFLDPGKTFTHTFTKPGTFSYHCDPHPWMVGKVTVKEK